MEIPSAQVGLSEGDDEQPNAVANVPTVGELVNNEADVFARQISIAILNSERDQSPKVCDTSVREFVEGLKRPDEHNRRKEGPAFLQGACPVGFGRSHIEAFEFLGFDVDDGGDPKEVYQRCEQLGLLTLIYPTFNDEKVVDGKCLRKYRVIVFLDRAIRREELGASVQEQKATLKSLRRYLAEWLKLNDDPACDDLPRIFYMHRRPKGVASWFLCTKARGALSADALLEVARARVVSAKPKHRSRGKGRKNKGGNPSVERREFDVFCRRFRDVMDVEQLVEDFILDSERKGTGIEAECPNRFGTDDLGDGRFSSGHGNEEGGRKLFAVNGEHSDCGTAVIMCQHATCQNDLSFEDFVWLIMQEGGKRDG